MTVITYQGLQCTRVRFRRRRGFAADLTEVVMPVTSFPGGFDFDARKSLLGRPVGEFLDIEDTLNALVPLSPALLPRGLEVEGELVMAQTNPLGGEPLTVQISNLFVVKIETEEAADTGDLRLDDEGNPLSNDAGEPTEERDVITFVKLTLADERLFWNLGACDRWSFNRLRADGTIAGDSLDVAGTFTLRKVLTDVIAPNLFRGYEVAEGLPEILNGDRDLQLPVFEAAVRALAELIEVTGLEDPCFRLDGTLALHEVGKGRVASAAAGRGPNAVAIPPGLVLYAAGRGRSFTLSANYPPEYALVVGDPTIATVAIDDWEPVVMIRGRPFFLSEEFVRRVTGGDFGLEWLKAFVMLPKADQGNVLIAENVSKVFREQGFRYYRCPGVETIEEGFYTELPGRNAHLLPMLARAEVVAGRRQRATIETFRWTIQRKELAASPESSARIRAAVALQEIKETIRLQAARAGESNPLERRRKITTPFTQKRLDSLGTLFRDAPEDDPISRSTLATMVAEVRRLAEISDAVGGDLSGQYDQAIRDKLVAEDGDTGVRAILYDLAKKLIALEKKAEERLSPLEFGSDDLLEAIEGLREEIDAELDRTRREIQARQSEEETRERTGQRAAGRIRAAVTLRNLSRAEDAGARVFSAEMGVIKTSGLAGHAQNPVVSTPARTSLVPCPVRVIFGATLRPRVDKRPTDPDRPVTGGDRVEAEEARLAAEAEAAEARAAEVGEPLADFLRAREPLEQLPEEQSCPGGDNLIPEVLSDQETYFVAAFKRQGRAAFPITLDDLQFVDNALGHVLRIPRPLAKLVPLNGATNENELLTEAAGFARSAFDKAPVVRGASLELCGPIPINPDGIVAGIEIASQPDGHGFTTTVSIGSSQHPTVPGITRPNKATLGPVDALEREGLA